MKTSAINEAECSHRTAMVSATMKPMTHTDLDRERSKTHSVETRLVFWTCLGVSGAVVAFGFLLNIAPPAGVPLMIFGGVGLAYFLSRVALAESQGIYPRLTRSQMYACYTFPLYGIPLLYAFLAVLAALLRIR